MFSEQDKLENYELGKLIGRGGSSEVFAATCKKGRLRGRRVAIKIIPCSSLPTPTHLSHHLSSTSLHLKLHHPSLLSLLSTFNTSSAYYHVLELCSAGTISSFLSTRHARCLTEEETRGVLKSLVDGLVYLKKEGVLHRDIKADNVLLTEDYRVKLADFGLATKLVEPNFETSTFCGTPNYLSPEVISRRPYGKDSSSDLWALGCLTITLLTGCPPFQGDSVDDTLARASKAVYELPKILSYEVKDLIGSLLQINPQHRIPVHRIASHPFFNPSLLVTPLTTPPSLSARPYSTFSTRSSRPLHAAPHRVWGATDDNKENVHPPSEASTLGVHRPRPSAYEPHEPTHDNYAKVLDKSDKPILGVHFDDEIAEVDAAIHGAFRRAVDIPLDQDVSFSSTTSAVPQVASRPTHDVSSRSQPLLMARFGRQASVSVSADQPSRQKDSTRHTSQLISPPPTEGLLTLSPRPKHPRLADLQKASKPNDPPPPPSASASHVSYPSNSSFQHSQHRVHNIPDTKPQYSYKPRHLEPPFGTSFHRHSHTSQSTLSIPSTVPYTSRGPPKRAIPSIVTFSPPPRPSRVPEFNVSHRPRSPPRTQTVDLVASQNQLVRLSTSALQPQTHKTPHGHLTILEDPSALIVDLRESERKAGKRGDEIIKIGSDGNTIEVFSAPSLSTPCVLANAKATWSIESLPKQYWKRYRFAYRFVQLVKSRTPKFIFFTPLAKCTMMSNDPSPDVELLFPCPQPPMPSSIRPSGSSSTYSTDPVMRVRLSRHNHTIEISRFVPLTSANYPFRTSDTSLPNVTEVQKGEWTKKVLTLPKSVGTGVSNSQNLADGLALTSAERAGVDHLEECCVVCQKLEEIASPPLLESSSDTSRRPESQTTPVGPGTRWKSFLSGAEEQHGASVVILREEAWDALRPTSKGKEKPEKPFDNQVRTNLAVEIDNLEITPRQQKLSPSPRARARISTSTTTTHQERQLDHCIRDVLLAIRKGITNTSNDANDDDGGADMPSQDGPPPATRSIPTGIDTQFIPVAMETRFLACVGWCVRYGRDTDGTGGERSIYKVMFLDGASLEVDVVHCEAELIDRKGRCVVKRTQIRRNMPQKIKERLAVFEEFVRLF